VEVAAGSDRGFSLLFVTLPVALGQLPFSQLVITAVFTLVLLIVWATAISLLEPVVGWFREWIGAPRGISVVIIGGLVWFAGLASLFSFNIWTEYRWAGGSIFRWLEVIAGGVLIPLVAFMISVFTGWCLTKRYVATLLGDAPSIIRRCWYWIVRLVLPFIVVWVGLQYTLFSLSSLCDRGADAIWCGEGEVRSLSESAPEMVDIHYHGVWQFTELSFKSS